MAPEPAGPSAPAAALRRRARRWRAAGAVLAAVLLVALGYGLATLRGDGGRTADDDGRAPASRIDRSHELAIGLVSRDVAALTPRTAGTVPGYAAAQDLVGALAPRSVRVDVRWDQLQPDAGTPLDVDRVHDDGCGRDAAPPCGPPITLAAIFARIAAQRVAHPGAFRPLITFWGMPEWAGTAPVDGCRSAAVRAGARPLAADRAADYRAAIRTVWTALEAAGIREADWTPWNEPNAPYFLDPQRADCARDAAPRSPAPYARLVAAMDAELRALRGPGDDAARDHRLVVGELAAWGAPTPRAVPSDEFLRDLPDATLCRADVVSLHGYLDARPPAGRGEPLAAALGELDRRPCLDDVPVWITETGVGAPRSGGTRDTRRATLRAECRLMHDQLTRWYHHPRITAAYQYSVRDDAAFPTGLLDEGLDTTYPVAAAWRAWAGDRPVAGPPAALPATCRDDAEAAGSERPPG